MPERRIGRFTGSVRIRATAAVVVITALALSAGAVLMVSRFRQSLDSNRRSGAVSRAVDIAGLAASGQLPPVLALPGDDATFAQVVDSRGRVLAASANIAGDAAVSAPLRAGAGPVVTSLPGDPVGGDGHSKLVALSAPEGPQRVTVFTGFSLVPNDLAVEDLRLALIVGLPAVLALVGVLTWLTVGRALRPIESIRREVADISTRRLHRRVPEPTGSDEVARLARTMNSMLDRLETAMEQQKAFVADASHELRSPLASLRAQLEIGLAGGGGTDWPATAADALAEEARIEKMVGDLLLLARLDRQTGPGPGTAPARAELDEIVATEVGIRSHAPGRAFSTRVEGPATVGISAELARRLVANLLDNAQRHAARDVSVTIDSRAAGTVRLTVQDDGPGVAAADRQRVFERFTRLDRARASEDGGAGLGLAIVHDIVAAHHGTVAFTDCDRGARIEVELPAAGPAGIAGTGGTG
ncbi:MAG TPA: ATP-binding protein [Acidimicrobiales bacterium]|nr:ATP-binding protein [Acidimicrobiales bacterium]